MTGLLTGSWPPRRRQAMPSQQQFLEPKPQTWGWTVAGLLAVSVIATGVLVLIGYGLLAILAPVVLPLLAIVVGIFGARVQGESATSRCQARSDGAWRSVDCHIY